MSAAAPAFARAPRRARLRAVAGAAALLATTLGGPALGQPVVIDSYVGVLDINPGFSCGNNCFTTGTRALQITASGELNAPIGHGIVLGGPLHNLGRLRAAFGAEIGGLDIGGGGLNGEDALIQAHTLYVRGGAGFDNRGLLLTGIYTVPPPNGREATAPALGAGASIGGGTTLRNMKSPLLTVHPDNGTWRNFGAVTVAGVFDNAGDFRAEFNPQTTLPASGVYWPQLLVKNTGDQAKLINRAQGRLFFNASTQLSNGGHVDNSGVINIAGGGVLYNDPTVSDPLYVQPGQLAGWIDNRAGGRIVIGEPGQNFGLLWNAGGSIVNHGDIEFRGAGYYDGLSFRGVHGSLENHGRVVQARDARLLNGILINQPSGTLDLGGTSFLGYLSNQGQLISRPGSALIAQAGSALYNEGGRIELGGRITVIGSLQNGNFNLPATPSTIDILAGGELSVAAGGHFEQHIGSRVNNAGRLVVAGTAVGGALEPVTLRNSGELVVQAGGSWQSQAGELHNEAGGRVTVAGRMTGLLGDGSSPPTTAAWINNEGDFVIETGARVHAYSFTQLAGNLQVQGDLLIDAGLPGDPDNVLRMTGGSLSGTGRINGDVFFQGSGPPLLNPGCNPAPPAGVPCFKPGNSPGHMGIDGALTMGANSVLELEVERDGDGLLHWDTVSATRMSFLDGALIRVLLGSGVAGALPANFSFLSCAEACDFSGAVFEFSGAGSGQFALGAQGLQFTLAPVPEPGQWALWLAGLAGLGALARRRPAARGTAPLRDPGEASSGQVTAVIACRRNHDWSGSRSPDPTTADTRLLESAMPRRDSNPRSSALVGLLATLASLPAMALPVVIDAYREVVRDNAPYGCGERVFCLTASQPLQINPSGQLHGPFNTLIGLAGGVDNQGVLRAAMGSEGGKGLALGGASTNRAAGRIEAHTMSLTVGTLTNNGLLHTGIYTPPGGSSTTSPLQEAVMSIAAGAGLDNTTIRSPLPLANSGVWRSFGDVVIQGRFNNDGLFSSQPNLANGPAGSYAQTVRVAMIDPGSGVNQAVITNTFDGLIELHAGTILDNGALIENRGTIRMLAGARFDNRPAASSGPLLNLFKGLVVSTGQFQLQDGASFENHPAARFNNLAAGVLDLGSEISTGVAGQALLLNRGEFENRGLMRLYQSNVFAQTELSSFLNSGTLLLAASKQLGMTGSWENRALGTLDLRGNAVLVSHAFLSSQGLIKIASGAGLDIYRDATLRNDDGGRLEVAGRLAVDGLLRTQDANPQPSLHILPSGEMLVFSGARLDIGYSGRLKNQGQLFVGGDVGVEHFVQVDNSGQIIIETGATWHSLYASNLDNQPGGYVAVFGSMVGLNHERPGSIGNQGDFLVAHGARAVAGSFVQYAGSLAVQGELIIDSGPTPAPDGRLTMHGGSLSGSGRINGDVFFQGSGPPLLNPGCNPAPPTGVPCFKPGNSPGHMGIDGALTMGANSVLELEVERDGAGLLHWDTVSATRMSFLDGALIRVLLGSGVAGALPSNLSFLSCAEACDFAGAAFEVSGAGSGQFTSSAQGLQFTLAPVPEPGQWALWLAGLAGLGALARRRRAASNPS